jgi:hypothetical protein
MSQPRLTDRQITIRVILALVVLAVIAAYGNDRRKSAAISSSAWDSAATATAQPAKQNYSPPRGPSQSVFCSRWGALLEGGGAIVKSYECSVTPGGVYNVTATIADEAWTSLDYDQRLRLAKALWSGCLKASGVASGDSCYIHLEGEAGEKLGGSGWAGSLIDVSRD